MTELNAASHQETAIRELTAEELDLVSGGGVRCKEPAQEYFVLTLKEVLIT